MKPTTKAFWLKVLNRCLIILFAPVFLVVILAVALNIAFKSRYEFVSNGDDK
jgi:lipopolysaccharide/colanic/teichoic acid biosynthesis glycosyltransferase